MAMNFKKQGKHAEAEKILKELRSQPNKNWIDELENSGVDNGFQSGMKLIRR
jgi:hypothetical protein